MGWDACDAFALLCRERPAPEVAKALQAAALLIIISSPSSIKHNSALHKRKEKALQSISLGADMSAASPPREMMMKIGDKYDDIYVMR